MIVIFEPGSVEYNVRRGEQEMNAARASLSLPAKMAHFDLAARHFGAARDKELPGRLHRLRAR